MFCRIALVAVTLAAAFAGTGPHARPADLPLPPAPAMAAEDPVAHTAAALFVSRCLPRVTGAGAVSGEGLTVVPQDVADPVLGARPGTMWMVPAGKVMIADYTDREECMVIANWIDLGALDGALGSMLIGSAHGFRRTSLETAGDGGYAARFESTTTKGMMLDITAVARTPSRPSGAVLRVVREPVEKPSF